MPGNSGKRDPLERIADVAERLEAKVDLGKRFDRIEDLLRVVIDGQDVILELLGDGSGGDGGAEQAAIDKLTARLNAKAAALKAAVENPA